jgi:hypothetical protein
MKTTFGDFSWMPPPENQASVGTRRDEDCSSELERQ